MMSPERFVADVNLIYSPETKKTYIHIRFGALKVRIELKEENVRHLIAGLVGYGKGEMSVYAEMEPIVFHNTKHFIKDNIIKIDSDTLNARKAL